MKENLNKNNLFSKKIDQKDYPSHQPLGLYDSSYEHDACGVGMLVNINGDKSHELVDAALTVLENMKHRGAEGADNKTGDGAGIMIQIPHEFILLQGIPVPEKGKYGTGLVFLPKDEKRQAAIMGIVIEEVEREGLQLMHMRNVPVRSEILGKDARDTEPDIKQIFITGVTDTDTFERTLYLVRKRIERRIDDKDFYIVSLSSKNIIYKGMLSSTQVREYFKDLTQPYFTSGLALVHSRFSTNTFPTWSLAQPFRLLAHNGEINTIRGNRAWMEARESVLSTPALGNVKDIRPIIQPGMSDSASLDNVLEFFVMSGLSLPHAMAMLVPESFNDKNPISEDLKAFYEYHSILMEPWDGPAALLFSDGRYAGGMLDRTIITASDPAISNGKEVSLEYAIANTDRAVGAMLSGLIADKFGNEGLPDESISVRFKGSAGQSFGAFLAHGISFKLEGEANDYLGKGLSGGRIAVAPPVRSHFAAEKNTIAGNTLLYGATSGEVYINGRVGERFAVRNSGAIAVVEGVGDHCCEYMTGGRVVVLGATGRNFAAGMSGGVAYVWDPDRKFDYFCNMEMVELSLIEDSSARKELHELIRQHYRYTGSALARQMLDEWNRYVDDFIQVTPIEYKRVLAEEQMLKLQQKIAEVQRDY